MTVRRESTRARVPRYLRETCEKSGTSQTDDGSRSEVRGFRNFEPRTSNIVLRLSRFSRQSRPSRLSQGSAMATEAFMELTGLNTYGLEYIDSLSTLWYPHYTYTRPPTGRFVTIRLVTRIAL